MAPFKQRGILVLGVILCLALLVVETVKAMMGWQTNSLTNAVVVGVIGLVGGAVLRRHGFYPFAARPKK